MKSLFLAVLTASVLILTGCKGGERIVYVPVQDSTYRENITTITDEPVWTNPDSLLLQFALECDSNYNVLLKRYYESNSGLNSRVKTEYKTVYREDKTKVNQLILDVSAYSDSIRTLNRTIENQKRLLQVKPKIIERDVPVKYTPKWKNYCTIGFFGFILVLIVWVYFKFRMKILSFVKR